MLLLTISICCNHCFITSLTGDNGKWKMYVHLKVHKMENVAMYIATFKKCVNDIKFTVSMQMYGCSITL